MIEFRPFGQSLVLFNPCTPSYLKERFMFLSDTYSRFLRSSESLERAVPSHSTSLYDKSFIAQSVRPYDALSIAIRRPKSLPILKIKSLHNLIYDFP